LAKEERQMAKTTANCSNSFCHLHLISSVSRSQRPLIKFWVKSDHTGDAYSIQDLSKEHFICRRSC
jgi:hypothetical protein